MAKLAAKRVKKEHSENQEFLQTEPKEIETLSLAQKKYLNVIKNNILTFATGCAGTGKSFIALSYAAEQLKAKRISKIIITRPLVETGEKLGYLPGPQPLDAKIATPTGWTTMGELEIGDYVIGKNGKPIEVLNIFPKGEKDVYKIITTDGTSTECCSDHLWFTTTAKERKILTSYKLKHSVRQIGSVKSTYDIANSLLDNKGRLNHHIPRNEAVEYDYKEVSIPPYSLGCLLGDGSFSNSVCLTNIDADIIDRFTKEMESIGCGVSSSENSIIYNVRNTENGFNKPARKVQVLDKETGIITIYESTGITSIALGINKNNIRGFCNRNSSTDRYEFSFTDDIVPKYTNIIKNKLEPYGLMFSKCYDKFIPDDYKYNSIDVRLEVLRGLMDTDGTVKKTGESSFTTVSERLADDIIELVRSLGGRATKCMRNRVGQPRKRYEKYNDIIATVPSYEFTISMPEHYNPFYTRRKAERYSQRYIHGVGIASIEYVGKKEVQCILVNAEDHLYLTDNFIVTHNTMEEKISPYFDPMIAILNKRLGQSYTDYLIKRNIIEAKPLAYLRGSTFENSMVILDESQNTTPAQMMMFLTRIGENCKMIVDGDLAQSDIRGESGLHDALSRLKPVNNVGHIHFTIDDVVRSGICKDILIAYGKPKPKLEDIE